MIGRPAVKFPLHGNRYLTLEHPDNDHVTERYFEGGRQKVQIDYAGLPRTSVYHLPLLGVERLTFSSPELQELYDRQSRSLKEDHMLLSTLRHYGVNSGALLMLFDDEVRMRNPNSELLFQEESQAVYWYWRGMIAQLAYGYRGTYQTNPNRLSIVAFDYLGSEDAPL